MNATELVLIIALCAARVLLSIVVPFGRLRHHRAGRS